MTTTATSTTPITSDRDIELRARGTGQITDHSQAVQYEYIVPKGGKNMLHLLRLSDSEARTGMTIFNHLIKEYNSTKPSNHWYNTRPQIYEAIVSPYCIGDPESQDYPREVIAESYKLRPDFTMAFNNPTLLRGTTNFIALTEQFNILSNTNQTNGPRRALLIKTEVNMQTLMIGVALAIAVSIGGGVALGVPTHRVDFGLLMTAGMITIFSLLQATCSGFKN